MTDTENQEIEHEGDPRAYFTMFPNLADDAGLDVYAFRLLIHYYRVGKCWESTRTTASKTMMSPAQVCQSRKDLEAAGWVKLGLSAHETISITLIDKWAENAEKYHKRSRGEQGVHGVNGGVHGVNERRTIEEKPIRTDGGGKQPPPISSGPALELDLEEDKSGYAKREPVGLMLPHPKTVDFKCVECGAKNQLATFSGQCESCGTPHEITFESGAPPFKPKNVAAPLPPVTPAANYLRDATSTLHHAMRWYQFASADEKVRWEQEEKRLGVEAMKGWVDWAIKTNASKKKIVDRIFTCVTKHGAPTMKDAETGEVLTPAKQEARAKAKTGEEVATLRRYYEAFVNGLWEEFEETTGQHPFEFFDALVASDPEMFQRISNHPASWWPEYRQSHPSRTI